MAATFAGIPLLIVLSRRPMGASWISSWMKQAGEIMTCSPGLNAAPAHPSSNKPTLDQLLAEPIVQQLMRRDRIDEATIRQLLQETASARLAAWAKDDLKADDPHFCPPTVLMDLPHEGGAGHVNRNRRYQ
jgi:hypothetical protein